MRERGEIRRSTRLGRNIKEDSAIVRIGESTLTDTTIGIAGHSGLTIITLMMMMTAGLRCPTGVNVAMIVNFCNE